MAVLYRKQRSLRSRRSHVRVTRRLCPTTGTSEFLRLALRSIPHGPYRHSGFTDGVVCGRLCDHPRSSDSVISFPGPNLLSVPKGHRALLFRCRN